MHPRRARAGWSRTDLVLVAALLLLLALMMIPRFASRLAASRDARRLEDMQRLQAALAQYFREHGQWPPAQENVEQGGWDVSSDGDFVPELARAGCLERSLHDPLDDEQYQYRYRVFPSGSHGCGARGAYYVLGLRAFESEECARAERRSFACSERDWGQELAWSTGQFAPAR